MRNTILFMLMVSLIAGAGYAASPVTNGLVKHVDASAITSLSNGDPISVATDLSGTQDMIQDTADNQPIYVTGAMNGLPVIRFDGTDDFLRAVNDTKDLFSGDQTFTILSVCSIPFSNCPEKEP